jgi:hypothetical protein
MLGHLLCHFWYSVDPLTADVYNLLYRYAAWAVASSHRNLDRLVAGHIVCASLTRVQFICLVTPFCEGE